MYDWLIEADLYRLRKTLRETENRAEAQRIGRIINAKTALSCKRPGQPMLLVRAAGQRY